MPTARTCVDINAKPTTNAVTAPEGDSLRVLAPFTLRYKAMRKGKIGSVVQDMVRGAEPTRFQQANTLITVLAVS